MTSYERNESSVPINVNSKLPAVQVLRDENIFVMTDERASSQDIRPLRIAILNIMPTKVITETQLLRLLGNTPLQVEIQLLHMASHDSKNTEQTYLDEFYKTFSDVKHEKFDGLIITGAPVENIPFEEVDYWDELKEIMEWSKTNVFSTFHICWGAQAGLYYHYGIKKHLLDEKMFGVFEHRLLTRRLPIIRGFDDMFYAPHSRHTGIDTADIENHPDLTLVGVSEEAGPYLIVANNARQIFCTGHSEYDRLTLKREYDRDVAKNLPIKIPANYFPGDDPNQRPIVRWRSHAALLFSNWLNYYVYQETPYDLNAL